MEQLERLTKRIHVFPMVKYYMNQLDLYTLLHKYVPPPMNGTLEAPQVLCVIVANTISASKPLYKVEEWLADYTDALSEQPMEASLYNDDQLGRSLGLGCLKPAKIAEICPRFMESSEKSSGATVYRPESHRFGGPKTGQRLRTDSNALCLRSRDRRGSIARWLKNPFLIASSTPLR